MIHKRTINRVSVLGSGVMGSRIACHFAGTGLQVLLLDMAPKELNGAEIKKGLKFVVQRHDASNLHYDFRLEMNGVLKSWAIPKGPSLNPKDKRLAVMVEDHPYDYRNFEGEIPEGNYGTGTVYIFDEGEYESIADGHQNDEEVLLEGLKIGSIKIKLKGDILKGEFALVKLKDSEKDYWLLIKHKDEYATTLKFEIEKLVPTKIKEEGRLFKKKWRKVFV